MATRTIYISGICEWARCHPDNMDTRFGNKYTIWVKPDQESTIALRASGSRVKAHDKGELGVWYKFSRDDVKSFRKKDGSGEQEEKLGPPKLWDANEQPMEDKIGNGSKVTVRLSVYDSSFGPGTRLDAVRVDTLVPYVPRAEDAF